MANCTWVVQATDGQGDASDPLGLDSDIIGPYVWKGFRFLCNPVAGGSPCDTNITACFELYKYDSNCITGIRLDNVSTTMSPGLQGCGNQWPAATSYFVVKYHLPNPPMWGSGFYCVNLTPRFGNDCTGGSVTAGTYSQALYYNSNTSQWTEKKGCS